jgi:hypothetical protein
MIVCSPVKKAEVPILILTKSALPYFLLDYQTTSKNDLVFIKH